MSSPTFNVTTKSQFIRAGAGAGKTTQLISTFIGFVTQFREENKRFPRVVMTTFTRKATQEVKERLLVSAIDKPDVFEYINKKSNVHISTIHGLLSLFLVDYAEKIKFPQEIKIVDGPQYDRVLKKKINELLKTNTQYVEILEHYSFNELVQISKKALEFKAENKNFSFIDQIDLKKNSAQHRKLIIKTIDDIFRLTSEPSKSWIEYFGYLAQIKDAVQKNEHARLLEHIENSPSKPRWSEKSPSLDPVAHELVLQLKDELLDPVFDSDQFIEKHQQLNQLFFEYVEKLSEINFEHKRATGELTIADLEILSLKIIQEFPQAAEEFSNAWDYFMVDEYQDTSPLQVQILNSLIRNKPCFVVGDPQQSIYLFRGARSEVFAQKQAEMEVQKAEVMLLQTNYRSEPALMNYINHFFSQFSPQFTSMKIKSSQSKLNIPYSAMYVKTEDQKEGVLQHIQYLLKQGSKPQDICILSRNNRNLEAIAIRAFEVGINVQLQSAAGFEEKREILDLIAFNRFLVNPHDDENLILLLRSPWFFTEDVEIVKMASQRITEKKSFWALFQNSENKNATLLKQFLNFFDSMGVLQTTKQFISQTQFMLFSDYYDRTGKREANVFKYLMSLSAAEQRPDFSLGLFLEDQFQSLSLNSGSSNSEAQPVMQPDCVSLMTVHASKGLQFKHVILVGMADAPNPTRVDRLSFDSLSQKFSLSVFDDQELKLKASNWSNHLRDSYKQRESAELERVLYVAMTRAIESISLVSDTSKRSNKNTWLAQVVWPSEGEQETETYKTLSVEYSGLAEAVIQQTEQENLVRPVFSDLKSDLGEQSQSITDLITSQGNSDKPNYEHQLINLKKAQYGSDLHRIFESLKYLEVEEVKKRVSPTEIEAIDYLFSVKEIDIKKLLAKSHNEWGFGLKTKTKFIQGQIDLWAELDSEIHVLDYKTGSSAYKEKAFEQLDFYTKALLEMKQVPKNKKIIHTVIYPIEKSVVTKSYKDQAEFEKSLSPKIKEVF
jgi:ATP-dependent helicase/nuclease subunit A